MTDQHPLTDDIIADIAHGGYIDDYCKYHYVENDLRAAADWQLEQVIEWMKVNLIKHGFHEGYAYLYKDLKKAMRPQQLEDN
jgi:hypothetical protein